MKKLVLHNRDKKVLHEIAQNNMEIDEASRKEKYQKMAVSPYTFYRGANHLYWEDFYQDWRINFFGGTKETLTWINGDAHIYNYGAYANHYGEAIFCMDDFDDSVIADYQFDLWRMAVSIVLDCRDLGVFTKKEQKNAVKKFAKAYRKQMCRHSKDDPDNEFHLTAKTADGLVKKFLKKVEKKKSREKMLTKWTTIIDGKRCFDLGNQKLEKLTAKVSKSIQKALLEYTSVVKPELTEVSEAGENFKVKDLVKRKSAGTGSLGCARYYALIEGDSEDPKDDVILDIKEQGKPPLYEHMSEEEQKEFDQLFPNQAERHALACLALAEHPDQYLGWLEYNGSHFSVKERAPYKADFPTEDLEKPKDLYFMSKVWGDILASRHKRASYILNDQANEMPEAFHELLNGKDDEFDDLVCSVAFRYADCVEQDYRYLINR